tara:strand:- start:15608 stop:15796 length:189 start_codon:yes stop_codon:yes gene_type:complete
VSARKNKHLRTAQPELGPDDGEAAKEPVALGLRHGFGVGGDVQRPDERVSAEGFGGCGEGVG